MIDSANNQVMVLEGDGHGNFSIITIHSTGDGSGSISMAVGDFDHDTISDRAIANNAINSILVLIAYMVYPVSKQVTYSSGHNSQPTAIAVGDLNDDTYLDVVVANWGSDNVGILFNFGNGTFRHVIVYPLRDNYSTWFVIVNDVNKDTKLDIIALLCDISVVQVLIGLGNGSFEYGDWYSTSTNANPEAMAMADLNNDKNLDIIVANSNDGVGVLLGNGDETFTNCTTHLNNMTFNPRFVAVADLNNDHYQDIVYVSANSSSVAVLFGHGNATFGSVITYSTDSGTWPWYVILDDFNNDRLLNIAISTVYGFYVGIFFGFGNGSFSQPWGFLTGYNTYPVSIASGDFSNDKQFDIVATDQSVNKIGVFLLHYVRNFTDETIYLTGSGSHPYFVAMGDFNQDNRSDVIVASSGNDDVQLFLNYHQDAFLNEITYSIGFQSFPQFVNVADFNRGGQLDIVVANNRNETINVFLGSRNSTFNAPHVYWTGTGSFPISIAVGDFNKDNWTDLVVANNGTNNLGVFLGFDYAAFTNGTVDIPGSSSSPQVVVVGDFNNDYNCDFAVISGSINYTYVYLEYGNGTFSLETRYSMGSSWDLTDVIIVDLNNDTNLDIAVTNEDTGNGQVGVLYGYGDGRFAVLKIYSTGWDSDSTSLAAADCNNDNQLDLAVSQNNINNIGIMLRQKTEPFATPTVCSTGNNSHPQSIVTGDFNNDDQLDIAVANSDTNSIGIFLGYGNGNFTPQQIYFIGNQSKPFSLAVGDFNNDYHLDIAVTNYGSNELLVFLGIDDGTSFKVKSYSLGYNTRPQSLAVGDVNGDGLVDIAVANYGGDYVQILLQTC